MKQLVDNFYAKVRVDPVLGPVFEQHITSWDEHLPRMVDFWSSALRGTARFRGAPMPKHAALPGLNADMFRHWLNLFRETCSALPNPAMGERASDLAERVADSLWYGYQMAHGEGRPH